MSREPGPQALVATVRVLLTAAVARADARWMRSYQERAYEFRLLAAADRSSPALPQGGWHDTRLRMRVEPASVDGELRLTFQAIGGTTLDAVAGRSARLRTAGGALDRTLTFDGEGRACAVLRDDAEVRQALARFQVVVADKEAGAAEAPVQGP